MELSEAPCECAQEPIKECRVVWKLEKRMEVQRMSAKKINYNGSHLLVYNDNKLPLHRNASPKTKTKLYSRMFIEKRLRNVAEVTVRQATEMI